MMKRSRLIFLMVLSIALCRFPAYADDLATQQRFQQLETQIAQLQNRVAVLERLLANSQQATSNNQNIYVCHLKPFTQTYSGESTNMGQAKRQAQKACLRERNEIFCRSENIRCETY